MYSQAPIIIYKHKRGVGGWVINHEIDGIRK